jgi:ribosomal protein S15
MSLTKEKKATIFANFGGSETNTGSIEGQIAFITERMAQIAAHLQQNKKDFSTHRGLMQLVGKSPPPAELPAKAQSAGLSRSDREIRNPQISMYPPDPPN